MDSRPCGPPIVPCTRWSRTDPPMIRSSFSRKVSPRVTGSSGTVLEFIGRSVKGARKMGRMIRSNSGRDSPQVGAIPAVHAARVAVGSGIHRQRTRRISAQYREEKRRRRQKVLLLFERSGGTSVTTGRTPGGQILYDHREGFIRAAGYF